MINKIKGFIRVPYLPYFLFLSALVIVSIIIFYHLDKNISSNISNNSALYLLSAMAQALAAILAIVIGFSFVAVQLSAQIGSPRVFDLILKDRALWLLLVIYGFSISYDLLLLRILPEKNIDNMFLVSSINFSIFLTFFSFMSLFPYAYNTIERLKPEKIIQGIIKIKYDNEEALKRDVILPIVDIMNKAIQANDPHTLKVGLDELEKLNVDVVKSSKIDSLYKLEIAKYYSGKISRLIDTSFNLNDEDSVIEIVDSLENIGEKSIEMRWSEVPVSEKEKIKREGLYRGEVGVGGKTDNYDRIVSEIKTVLNGAGNKAIKRKMSRATKSVLIARGSLLVASHRELVLGTMNDIFQISNDFSRLSDEEKIFSMDYFIETLRNTVIELINKDVSFDEGWYCNLIKEIIQNSLQAIGKDECFKMRQIIDYITDIGIEAAKKDHKLKDDVIECFRIIANSDKCLYEPISEIGNIGYGLALYSKKPETVWICSCLKEIGILYLSKKMDEHTINIFSILGGIENNYRHTKSSDVLEVTEKIIEIIEELGYKSIDYKLEKSSRDGINSLIQIGMMNENITIKGRVCKTLKDMQEKLENKEIFKSIMEINEKAQGYELVKFQEFKKFCDLDTVKHPR